MEKNIRSSCLFSVKIKFFIDIDIYTFVLLFRDVKPDNILLDEQGKEKLHVFYFCPLGVWMEMEMGDVGCFFALCIMCIYFSIVILGSNFCSSDRHTSLQDLKWVDWLMAFSASPGAQPFVTPEFILGYYSLVFMVFSSLIIVMYITFLFWLPCCVLVLLL